MNKILIYGGASLGGLLGGYLPVTILHANPLGSLSIIGGLVGTLAGLYAGVKAYQYFDE